MDQFEQFKTRVLSKTTEYPCEAVAAILANRVLFPPTPVGEQLEFWDLPLRSFFLETDEHLAKTSVFLLDLMYEIIQYVLNDSLAMIRHHENQNTEREERRLMIQAEAGLMMIIKGRGKFAQLPEYRSQLEQPQADRILAILRLHRVRSFSQTQPSVNHYFKLILARRTGDNLASEEEV